MTYLSTLNYIGDIAFAAGGILMARKVTKNRFIWFIAAVLTAFGGGAFIRDLTLLRTVPSILGSPHEIAATVAFALAMVVVGSRAKKSTTKLIGFATDWSTFFDRVLLIMDSLGILAFAAIGYERGIKVDGSLLVAVLCGCVTAVGGGVLARIITSIKVGKPFTYKIQWLSHELYRNIPYYAYGLATTLAYSMAATAIGKDLAMIVLTIPTVLMGILTDKKISARD